MLVPYFICQAVLTVILNHVFNEATVILLDTGDEACETCPSYCDDAGTKYEPVDCRTTTAPNEFPFCCNYGMLLACCNNESLKITSDVTNDFHCNNLFNNYSRTVLSVCVPVGFVCFVGVIVLFIYQRVRRKRRNSSRNETYPARSRSSSSTSRRSSVSSTESQTQTTIDDAVGTDNRQQQQHAVIISAGNLQDSYQLDDEVLVMRILQAVNAASATTNTGLAAEGCFVIQSTVHPPPYTDDKPPSYSDVFPS